MNKYITEFIGTFFLVLTVGCSVVIGGAGVIAPLAIGSVLMTMIYAGGHISGGHYNPAVTLGVWLRGRAASSEVIPYWLAQLIGAVLASAILNYLKGESVAKPMVLKVGPALVAEFLFTFALVYVVLNSATAKANAGNSFYGLAIGFTVMAGALSVCSVSSAGFYPPVAVGGSIMGPCSWANILFYLLANFSAGVVAAAAFKLLNPEDV